MKRLLTGLQIYVNKLRDRLSSRTISVQVVVAICVFIIFAIIAIWLVNTIFILVLAKSYTSDIAYVFDLNKHYANAIALIVFLVSVYFVGKAISFSRTSRRIGYLGIMALLIGHALLLWHGTGDQFFDEAGHATKCYVLTRDGKVRFHELGHKIDLETGLPCREVTPVILERLKEYQAGKLPEQIVEGSPVFFDPRTGEPIIWYWASKSGEIKIFNLMGFNPENGDELNPVTKEIVSIYEEQEIIRENEKRPPQKIDPNTYPFFDSTTGKPQVWYWRGVNGEYEFYDNQGFHNEGDELKVIDKDVIAQWKQYVIAKKKEQQKRDQELRDNQERERLRQLQLQKDQERDQQQQAERRKRDEQDQADRQQRQAQSGAMCDQAAANPNDRQKPSNVAGVNYNDINSSEALEVCQTAMDTFPGEPRYKYQYARVLESSNPNLAIKLQSQLTRQRYIASFDNLGSLLLKRKDYSGAIAAFKNGAQANDPDSLVSLDLIQRGIVRVPDPESYRLALLARAAHLGHQGAQRAVEEQDQIIKQNQLQQQYQSQQEQLMLNLFGNILGGVVRH